MLYGQALHSHVETISAHVVKQSLPFVFVI